MILDVGMVGARVASKTRLAPTRRAPSRPSLRFGAALAAVGGLAACTPATAPGASRDVAARPAYVQLPASFPINGETRGDDTPNETAGEPRPLEVVQARPTALPFRVQVAASDAVAPSLPEFFVRFSRDCVTKAPQARGYVVHVEGTFAVPNYSLRVRYDGHTSRSLVLATKGYTGVALEKLANEWEPVTPGVHEVVVFARDQRGIVPTSNGALAAQVCRFELTRDGGVRKLLDARDRPILFSPEGTLHGVKEPTLMQVGGYPRGGWAQLRIERPDGGFEVHDLDVARAAAKSGGSGLFELAPLQNGDYTFLLMSDSRGGNTDVTPTSAYAQRLSVNRESVGGE